MNSSESATYMETARSVGSHVIDRNNLTIIETKTLYLSSIFEWFKGDFVEKSGSVEKFIAPYLSGSEPAVIEKGGLTVKSTEYHWSLNKQ